MKERVDLELLQGAVDIHIHSAPSLFQRHDTLEIVKEAHKVGLRAVVLKNHHICTVDRANAARREIKGIDVSGSLVLNYANGGINPGSVNFR